MSHEQLEFLISQYLDGSLDPLQRKSLESRLEQDAEARALFDQHAALDAALKGAMPEPAVRWDALERHLRRAVAQERAAADDKPVYSMARWLNVGRLAAAACLLLGLGLAVTAYLNHGSPSPWTTVADVRGPSAEGAAGSQVCTISVTGPAQGQAEGDAQIADDAASRPSRLVIASAGPVADDSYDLPY